MDDGQRLAKVETVVDTLHEHLHDIKAEQIRGREELEKLRVHTDLEFSRYRDHMEQQFTAARDRTDRQFAEARDRTDRQFAEARDRTDRQFAEVRASLDEIHQELSRTTRWLIGLALSYGAAILGIMAKMAGIV